MAQTVASMAGLRGSPLTVLEVSLQLNGSSRLTPVGNRQVGVARTGLIVRAQQGQGESETSRRAVLGLIGTGVASGSFVPALLANAAPPPSSGLTKPNIKVAAFAGEDNKDSRNSGVIRAAVDIVNQSIDGMSAYQVDISKLPILNTDLIIDGQYPPEVESFRQKVLQADCFLFGSPEYSYSVTPSLKNAIDWGYFDKIWADKAAAIVSTGYDFGGGRSQYVLRKSGVILDIHFINQPEFFLNVTGNPAEDPNFDKDGNLINPKIKEELKTILLALKAFTLRLQPK